MLIPHTRYPRFMLTIKHPILGVMDVTSYVDSWEYELGDVSGIGTGGSGADSVISILTFTLRNSGQNLYYWDEDAIIDESIPLDDLKEFPDDSKAVDLFTYLFQIEPNLARKSFSPRDQLTPWNKDAPLLYQNREVELYFADDPAKDLELLCRMYVSDIEPGRSTVRVKALDPAKMLQRAYILEKREYGSQGGVPAETVIEQIINNNVPDYANYAVTDVQPTHYDTESFPVPEQPNVETFILKREPITITGEAVDIYFTQTPIDPSLITTDGRQVTIDLSGYSELVGVELTYTYQVESFLYCPVPSQFMLTPYVPEYQSVWDAIQDIATQRGWYLGYRMVDGAWRLAFIEPPREKTIPDWTLTADHDFYTQDLATSDKDIRNLVKITYRNKATGKREAITVKDQDSIDLHSLSAMEIEEADTSNIDTTEEAFRMANSALHDLSSLTATTNIVMPLFPDIKLFDLIAVENKFISSTVDLFAVDSIRHSWSSGRLRTELVGSGKVIGGVKRWLKKETRPGRAEPITRGDIAPEQIDTDRLGRGATTTEKIAAGAITEESHFEFVAQQLDSTTSLDWVEIPNCSLSFVLLEKAIVIISGQIQTHALNSAPGHKGTGMTTDIDWWLNDTQRLWFGFQSVSSDMGGDYSNPRASASAGSNQSFTRIIELPAGDYTVSARFKASPPRDIISNDPIGNYEALVGTRGIFVAILKR